MSLFEKFVLWAEKYFIKKANECRMTSQQVSVKCPNCNIMSHEQRKSYKTVNEMESDPKCWGEVEAIPNGFFRYTCPTCKCVSRWSSLHAPFPVMDSIVSINLDYDPETGNYFPKDMDKEQRPSNYNKKPNDLTESPASQCQSRMHRATPKKTPASQYLDDRPSNVYRQDGCDGGLGIAEVAIVAQTLAQPEIAPNHFSGSSDRCEDTPSVDSCDTGGSYDSGSSCGED